MIRSQRKRKSSVRSRNPGVDQLIEHVVQGAESPERIFELCYWSREPELLEAIRMFAAMTPATQAALGAFFAIVGDAASVAASFESDGNLTLKSPRAAGALAELIDTREPCIEIPPELNQRIH